MIDTDGRLGSYAAAVKWGDKRRATKAIIVHRIGGHIVGDRGHLTPMMSAESVEHFYREHPHGVATTQLSGSWKSKLPIIRRWEEHGIPGVKRIKSFVPYHFLIDPEGLVWECSPIDTVGMHAASGDHEVPGNRVSVGIGVIGNFRTIDELETWERRVDLPVMLPTDHQIKALRELLRDLLVVYPDADVMTHDQQRTAQGKAPKGCPGARMAALVPPAHSWGRLAARHILDGRGRI